MQLTKGNFRINNRIKLTSTSPFSTETLPDKEGLDIEISLDNNQSYFVISTILPANDGNIEIKECGTRVIDYVEPKDYELYRMLVKTAISVVQAANYEEED